VNKRQKISFWLMAALSIASICIAAYSVLSVPSRIDSYITDNPKQLQGPQGPPGPQGATGLTGATGASGGTANSGPSALQSCQKAQQLDAAINGGIAGTCH